MKRWLIIWVLWDYKLRCWEMSGKYRIRLSGVHNQHSTHTPPREICFPSLVNYNYDETETWRSMLSTFHRNLGCFPKITDLNFCSEILIYSYLLDSPKPNNNNNNNNNSTFVLWLANFYNGRHLVKIIWAISICRW